MSERTRSDITRRDFLNGTLVGAGSVLLSGPSPLDANARAAGPRTSGAGVSVHRRCRSLAMRVALTASLCVFAGSGTTSELLTERQSRAFAQVCAHCHVVPGLDAPMLGDAAEWEARGKKGLEELVRNTVVGLGNMPPLGTCGFCREDDIRALVAFLSGLSPNPRVESER